MCDLALVRCFSCAVPSLTTVLHTCWDCGESNWICNILANSMSQVYTVQLLLSFREVKVGD